MILKHRDKELLRFEWIEPQGVRIVSVNEQNARFLPLDFKGEVTDENLWKWLSRRVVPRNRRNVDVLMAATGLDSLFKSGTVNPVNGESLALQIITNLKADPFVSYDELSELLGMPRRTVARRMKELADADRIRRVGAAKNGYWEVLCGGEGTRKGTREKGEGTRKGTRYEGEGTRKGTRYEGEGTREKGEGTREGTRGKGEGTSEL